MTVALAVKVNDGVVMATDSASTLIARDGTGRPEVLKVYNNASKLFSLVTGCPVGAMTWGAGSIGSASISNLAKHLRRRLMGDDPQHPDWELQCDGYTMEAVARRTKEFFHDEQYVTHFASTKAKDRPYLGLCVTGYSAGCQLPEVWQIEMGQGCSPDPLLVAKQEDCALYWYGEREAISRLVYGYGMGIGKALEALSVPKDQIKPAIEGLKAGLTAQLLTPPMPIQDAVDLARFLVDTTIGFMRFNPGASTVAGPVDIAAVTRYEGFKWVQRKLHYDAALNSQEEA